MCIVIFDIYLIKIFTPDSTPSCLGLSLLVKETPAEELYAIPSSKIGGFKRKSNEESANPSGGFIDHSLNAKKKRETFISEEQEVCLTPIGNFVKLLSRYERF